MKIKRSVFSNISTRGREWLNLTRISINAHSERKTFCATPAYEKREAKGFSRQKWPNLNFQPHINVKSNKHPASVTVLDTLQRYNLKAHTYAHREKTGCTAPTHASINVMIKIKAVHSYHGKQWLKICPKCDQHKM